MGKQIALKQVAGLLSELTALRTEINDVRTTYGTKRVLEVGDNIVVKSGFQYIVTKGLEIPEGANFTLDPGADLVLLDDMLARTDIYQGAMAPGSMEIAVLDFFPTDPETVQVFIGGFCYRYNIDYTIVGKTITATSVLNEAFGGTGTDGLGFTASENVQVYYAY